MLRCKQLKQFENVSEKTAFAIETCSFKINYENKQSNIMNSSFDLNQIKLDNLDSVIKNVNIRTVKNLETKLENNDFQTMNLKTLSEDFEMNLSSVFSRLNREQLYEKKIDQILALSTNQFSDIHLNPTQKLIVLIQILNYLNQNQALSNKATKILFQQLDQPENDTSSFFSCYVRSLLFAPSANLKLLDYLNKFNQELFGGDIIKFSDLFKKIADKTRILLEDKANLRLTYVRFQTKELYIVQKLIEYGKSKGFLIRPAMFQIYKKALKTEAIHSMMQVHYQMENVLLKRRRSIKISNKQLNNEIKKEIKVIIEKEYDTLFENKRNRRVKKRNPVQFSDFENYALYFIQKLCDEFGNLTYNDLAIVYKYCLSMDENEQVNQDTIGRAINERDKKYVEIDKNRKSEIEKLARYKFKELAKDTKKNRGLTYYSKETKYVALKLLNRDDPPLVNDIVRITNLCGTAGKPLKRQNLSKTHFYIQLPEIDQTNKLKYDRIIEDELSKLTTRTQFKTSEIKIHQLKRDIINGIVKVPKEREFKDQVKQFPLFIKYLEEQKQNKSAIATNQSTSSGSTNENTKKRKNDDQQSPLSTVSSSSKKHKST